MFADPERLPRNRSRCTWLGDRVCKITQAATSQTISVFIHILTQPSWICSSTKFVLTKSSAIVASGQCTFMAMFEKKNQLREINHRARPVDDMVVMYYLL